MLAAKEFEITNFFSQKEIDFVQNENIISRMYVKYNARNENTDEKILLPASKYIKEEYYSYEILTDEKAFIPYNIDSEKDRLRFYNILLSYSKLSGMKYYSRRDKKIQQFIKNAYRIDINTGKKIADIEEGRVKEYSINYFVQHDNRLGSLTFKSEIYNDGNNFVMINTSLTPVSYGFIKINDKEEYTIISFFIYDNEKKGFYYYACQCLRFKIDFLLKNGTISPTTFSNRLRAATVHLANLLGLSWENKLNPWSGKFDSY